MHLPEPTADLALSALLNPRHPIKMAVAEWARSELDPGDMVTRDRDLAFFSEAWQSCADEGILGSTVPPEFGGAGDDLITSLLKLEGLGLGCRDNGFGFAVASQTLTFQDALVRFGTEHQKRRFLIPACAGRLVGAFAITEPDSGSDTYAMSTTARPTADGWILDGVKCYITMAPVADAVIVFAVTDPDAGKWGISAFLVPTDRSGISCTPTQPKMGLRTTPFGDVELRSCVVSEDDLLGRPGAGASVFQACIETERALIMSTQLGAAERVLDDAVRRARTREQFGRPIGDFQAVSHRLADMRVRLEGARLLMYKAAVRMSRGERAALEAAISNLSGSEAVAEVALSAARIHGARGYVTDGEVEREVRDALGADVYSGTSDMQRNLIAALMGVGAGARL